MQLAILIVLLLILLVLAPWLLGVIAVAAAAYGAWIVAGFVLTVVASVIFLMLPGLFQGLFSSRKISSNVEQQIAEANRIYREKEAARREPEEQEQRLCSEAIEKGKASSFVQCKSCSAEIQRYGMYCPKCGKSPI